MSMIRVLAAACTAAVISSCSPEAPRFAFSSTERRGVLDSNGLRFVIMPDPSTKLVNVAIRYDVGAREDPPGKAGLAHLVEHMMFQVRPDGPQTPPIFQTIMSLATLFNANTSWDRTHFFETSQAYNLDAMLKIEAMRMYYGCQNIPEGEFEREREVVRNEIRAQSSAEAYVFQLVEKAIYPAGHAYARIVGGDDREIASATLQDVCEFEKKYYTPDRALLVVAGGVGIDDTVKDIEKWFGRIPRRKPAPRMPVAPFVAQHTRTEIDANVDRPAVWIGWALPASNTPEGEAAEFGIEALIGSLAQKSQEYGFAYSIEPAILGGQLAPLFLVRIELKGMGKLDEALDFAKNAAQEAGHGWDTETDEQLKEEKDRQKAQFIEQLERLANRTEEVADLVQYSRDFDFNSSQMYLFHQLDKIGAFDNARIGSAVKKALDWNKAAIVIVKPDKNGIQGDTRSTVKYSATSDAAFTDPAVDPRDAYHPVKIAGGPDVLDSATRFTLKNGMHVVLLPTDAPMPLAAATLIFKNAGDASTPDDPALADSAARFLHLPFSMDPEGNRLTDVYLRTGVNVRCRASDDAMTCSTHGVNMYLDVMVRGLERTVKAGEYSQDLIEHWQKRVRDDWKLPETQETNEYVRQVMTALYGPTSPYTKTAILTPAAADKIHSDALDAFRRHHFTAGNATLVIAGTFKLPYAQKLVHDTFDDWDTGTIDKPVDPKPFHRTGPAFIGVTKSKPDQQVTVTVAYPAPAGIDGQEAAREVVAEMLNIRASDVRFKLGSTYGLYMTRQAHIGPGAYMLRGGAVMGGTIDAERAGVSIKALRDGFAALRAGDHFDEDFVRARRNILNQLLATSTVTTELAARLGKIAEFDLKPTYYETLLQQVAAVSPAQVKMLLETELDPANEVVVVLADKDHLDKTFAGAGITDVKIVVPEYK